MGDAKEQKEVSEQVTELQQMIVAPKDGQQEAVKLIGEQMWENAPLCEKMEKRIEGMEADGIHGPRVVASGSRRESQMGSQGRSVDNIAAAAANTAGVRP